MSVYGGFLTKKQSIQYFSILEDIIKLMQSNVMDSFTKSRSALTQTWLPMRSSETTSWICTNN